MSEDLRNKTCKELRELAKELNISGRWDMTKEQLVEEIMKANKNGDEAIVSEVCDVTVEEDNVTVVAGEVADEKKMKYIENVKAGTIVAFRTSHGKVKSAKVVKKSTKNRRLKLVTSYDAEYNISFDDVVWVRTGKRWPKGVYCELKGISEDEYEKRGKES